METLTVLFHVTGQGGLYTSFFFQHSQPGKKKEKERNVTIPNQSPGRSGEAGVVLLFLRLFLPEISLPLTVESRATFFHHESPHLHFIVSMRLFEGPFSPSTLSGGN